MRSVCWVTMGFSSGASLGRSASLPSASPFFGAGDGSPAGACAGDSSTSDRRHGVSMPTPGRRRALPGAAEHSTVAARRRATKRSRRASQERGGVRMPLFADLWSDAARGARSLLKPPAFAAATVGTLALGIGANAAMFSVVRAVLLAPLPYARPESRVTLWSRWVGFDKTWVSDAEVLDYRGLGCFRQVAAWSGGQANLTGEGEPVRVGMAQVTPNTFATLGAQPLLGRGLAEGADRPGADQVAVLGFGLWQSRYAGDPGVVGRAIQVDGRPRTVVGVMPPGFRLPTDFGVDAAEPTELWLPLALDPDERGSHGYYA